MSHGPSHQTPPPADEAAGALANADINILAVAQTSRQTNMQFIVPRDAFKDAQRALHRALCE